MKKIIISMMAVAALAACTKSEVQYEPAGEIGFAPVASNVTKSVAGYNGETFDGVFPTDVDLYVFANAVEGTYTAGTAGESYFANALFEWDSAKGTAATQEGVATVGAYAGKPTRYWPNVKKLVFAGYSDACGVAKNATMNFATNVLTIPSYTQNNAGFTAEGANDLMWFACDGTAYSKQADEVAAKMQHACSWITIKVAGDDNMVANGCKLNSLVVKSLAHTGSVACGAAAATWTIAADAVKADETYYNNATAAAVTATATKYEDTANNFIVIPQEPTDLEVTYTYTSDVANGITFTETKSVSLDYDTAGTAWKSGVHYIYTITITATEILIDPYVVEWSETSKDLGAI